MKKPTRYLGTIIPLFGLLLLAGCSAPKKPEAVELVYPSPPDPPRFYFERTLFGTGSVRQESDKDRLRTVLTGERSRAGAPFQKPFDVAVHQGRVFITDTVERIVHVLDFPEQKAFQIGDRGDKGDLAKPLGIAVDANGQVYVVDATARTVKVYDRNGNHLRDIGNRQLLARPSGVDVSPDGSRVFVVDTGGVDRDDAHRLLVFDGVSGQLLRKVGKRGTGAGEFNLARDVTLSPGGTLYVSDGGNFRVQALTQDGAFIREWGRPGRQVGQFSRPKGIATDGDGNVYVVDAAFGNFQIFNADGQILMHIGDRSTQGGPGKYMLPAGIDIDEDGRVYLVEQFYRKVDIFRPAALPTTEGYLAQPQEAE